MLFFKFLTRIFIPLGLGSLGSAIFISQVLGGYSDPGSWDLIKAASNGLFLFGAAGSCMGWAIEEQLRSSMYRQFFAQPGSSWQKLPLIFRFVFLVKLLLGKGSGFEN